MYQWFKSSPESTNAIPGDEFLKHQSPINKILAKLYAGFATSGQTAGSPDISGIDEGESQYIRGGYYN
jgi:hypothetical protein